MTDLDLLVTGAMVTFLAVSGAYVAIRNRANEAPAPSYKSAEPAHSEPMVIRPARLESSSRDVEQT